MIEESKKPFRAIYTLIWSDDKFPFCSDDAQLVFFHLHTNERTNALGIYKASIEALAADKRWGTERYAKGLGECLHNGFVKYDERFHVVYFPRYLKWNKPANPNVLTSWLKSLDFIPNSNLKVEFLQSLNEYVKRWGKGYGKPLALVTPNKDSDSDSDNDSKKPPNQSSEIINLTTSEVGGGSWN